ncbi:MAG: chemotaxis protein [Phycisphaeraceae bacterium]|nr:chemotaxis protein [Phycisphaeraceae bacterium]
MPLTTQTMSDQQYASLRKIIYDRSGIWFADSKKYLLESRLGDRLNELEIEDYDQYIVFLTMGPYREDEFQVMFSKITINETSFFRNQPQLDVFEKNVLPGVIEARRDRKMLRIWSAACSSGQEPYTLAMMVRRTLGIRAMDWSVEIVGTDISDRVLKIAKTALYPKSAIGNMSFDILSKYFDHEGDEYKIKPDIRDMVHFDKVNLKDRLATGRHGKFDVIFCRNVMIYFDDDMRKQCLDIFSKQLADDGTLFIGHSETIINRDLFTPRAEPQSFAYVKSQREFGRVA